MNWTLGIVSAILLILCFPGYNLYWLAPIAIAPLVFAAARETRWRRRFLIGYVSGIVYWFGTCNWIQFTIAEHGGMSQATAWFVFTLFSLAKALQTGAFAAAAGWTMRSKLAVPATAAAWVLMEYSHAWTGFTWLHLGNTAIHMSLLLRAAPWTGVWGISFVLAVIAVEIANLLLKRRGVPGLSMGLSVVLIAALFALPSLPAIEPGREQAVVVQPNIDGETNWTAGSFAGLLKRMQELSLMHRGSILVWPEAPAPFYDNDPVFMSYLQDLARKSGEYVLAGIVAHTPRNLPLNSEVLLSPDGHVLSRYDKVNLVPFGEFVPWPLGPIAFKVSSEAGDFAPGDKQVVSQAGVHKIAIFICYESVFPRFISRFVRNGAEVLFNPSNDGWFGKTSARDQHLEIVRMRAAENARWIVRDTNDGVTAAIDPAGRLRQTLPLGEETSATLGFNYRRDLTFYTRFGDWFVLLCVLMVLVSIAPFNHAESRARRHP